jgi:hypothetical protein
MTWTHMHAAPPLTRQRSDGIAPDTTAQTLRASRTALRYLSIYLSRRRRRRACRPRIA